MSDIQLKKKLNANAKHFRFLSRADTFHRNRKVAAEELDYLKYYPPEAKQLIISSLYNPIPLQLPPLAPESISYYRRSSLPVFKTRTQTALDAHMLYQSLWLLASLQEREFQNYTGVVKEFQQELGMYLSVNSADIRELAVIAAGNRIIGREAQIMRIVEADSRQMWVLVNHVCQKRISFKALLPYANHQIALKTLYQLTSTREDDSIPAILTHQLCMEAIVQALNCQDEGLRKYAIRILGNIVAQEKEYTEALHRYRLIDHILPSLLSSNELTRRDTCWLLSNLTCDRASSSLIFTHSKLLTSLSDLFLNQPSIQIQRELAHIFSGLIHFGQKHTSFSLLANQNFLQICYRHLCVQDNDLTSITLTLVNELLELGDNFRSGEGKWQEEGERNIICEMIGRMGDLRNQISKKSYSEHGDISSISLEIIDFLENHEP